jgi:two-component system CheB/CheR fusion protein
MERVNNKKAAPAPKRSSEIAQPKAIAEPFAIVGIGASAGGLEAMKELLRHLPDKTGMAYVLVQHLDPGHASVLAEILSRETPIPIEEATDGVEVRPDHVYVIPPNATMSIKDGVLRLVAREAPRGMHLPIDHFFHSLADDRGDQSIGVILSGTASDGTDGCSAIKAAGGITFAQDLESAKYDSMPRSAIQAGCIDFEMSPKNIANELVRVSRHPYIARTPEESQEIAVIAPQTDMDALFAMVREATGVDFMHYKQSMLQRRIKRRMVLHRLHRLKDYIRFIKSNHGEIDELYRDILIHVTGFFRDEPSFEALQKNVFPAIMQGRKTEDGPIRIWVPGCSTGEEVYSLAIVLLEYLWEHAGKHPASAIPTKAVQIFATDISDTALDRARTGLYTEAALSEMSKERLKRFFVRLDGGYQINKSIRELCIFAKQNIAKDPPFSNLDLISCRNLLIYLGPTLQKRVIPTLHYALKPSGYLMLGSSENLGSFSDHFTLIDKKYKIYQKKRAATRLVTYFAGGDYAVRKAEHLPPPKPAPSGFTVEREVERVLMNRFVPASIVVNDEMEIVQFRGKTGAYLEPASGHPTFSLSKMAREGLLIDLREALTKAKKRNEPVRRDGVRIKSTGTLREIDLEVIPIRGQSGSERFYIVIFQEAARTAVPASPGKRRQQKAAETHRQARDRERAEEEAKRVREQLQALIEDHETTLEEFKSANEEVQSANEELQSTNEELETAKEELQSNNEELTTLNEELQNRNAELTIVNNDQLNLMANVNIPVVMVGQDMRIRRFTPPAEKLLNLIPGDVGRRLGEIRSNMESDDIEPIAQQSIDDSTVQEKEVRQKDGPWYLLRVRPYKTWDNKLDGAVLGFQDIDALKRSLDETRIFAHSLIENAREATVVLNHELRVTAANPAFYRLFRVAPAETENQVIYDLGNKQWNVAAFRDLIEQVTKHSARIDDFEGVFRFPHIGTRRMLVNARRIEPQEGRQVILLSIEDITEQLESANSQRRLSTLLELATETFIVRDLKGKISFWNRGAEEMYGWKSEEAVGKIVSDLLRTKFPKSLKEIDADIIETGHWSGELVHTTHDGKLKRVASHWVFHKDEHEDPVILEINAEIKAGERAAHSD